MKNMSLFFFAQSKKKCTSAGIKFSILFALFVPGHMLNWAVEWTWLGAQIFITLFWFLVMHRSIISTAGIKSSTWVKFFLLFTTLGFTGALYGVFWLDFQISTADFSDLLRFLICIPLVLFIGSTIDESEVESVTLFFKFVILFNILTSAVLIFGVPGASDAIMYVYENAKVTYDFGYIRIGIPFTNPNFSALIFVLLLSYFLYFKKSLFFSILCFVAIFNTGSRSGFLASVPILLLAYVNLMRNALYNVKVMMLVIALHVTLFYQIATLIDTAEGFSRLIELTDALKNREIGMVNTASIRMDLVSNALEFIKRSPLFGVGPARSYGLEITDSQLVAWPLMYGIPGAVLIFGLFGFLFLNITRNVRQSEHIAAAWATFLSFFLMLATGDFMKNYRMFFITVLIAHCMYLVAHSNASTHVDRRRGLRRAPPLNTIGGV